MLPEPTDDSDALDHYVELLAAWGLEALCLTVVRGISVEEALRRFDGVPTGAEWTVVDAGRAAAPAYPDELPLVLVDELDGGVVLLEDNGYHGADREVLARLSAGTVAASAYWNVNLHSEVAFAHDGDLVEAFDFVTCDPPTGRPSTTRSVERTPWRPVGPGPRTTPPSGRPSRSPTPARSTHGPGPHSATG